MSAAAGPRWLELRVRGASGPRECADLLPDALVSLGARAVEERDGWIVTQVPEPSDAEAFVAAAHAHLQEYTGLGAVEIRTAWHAHENWAETWRRGLAPRRLTERLVVRPSWCEPTDPRDGDLVIVLDPGMAFGTAEHGTTRGCLRLLDGVVAAGDRLLDVGAGSGILAIAAALLGAAEVLAVESDPLACEALLENVERNGVRDRVRLSEVHADADWLAERGPVAGVVSNIESGLLLPLLPGFVRALEPGGWLILSGILAGDLEGVLEAAGAHELVEETVDRDGEWRSARLRLDS